MSIFRDDLLVLDNQSVCSSSLQGPFCTLQLFSVVCPMGLPPCILACSLVLTSCLFSHALAVTLMRLLMSLGETASQQTSRSFVLTVLTIASLQYKIQNKIGVGVFCRCIHWYWVPQFCILIGCVFFVMVSICCKNRFSWWQVKTTLLRLDPGGRGSKSHSRLIYCFIHLF